MDFGAALQALKNGRRIRRPFWAADTWLVLVPGSTITVTADRPLGIAAPELVGESGSYAPHIDVCTRRAGAVALWPWPKPDADLLADDWETDDLAGEA